MRLKSAVAWQFLITMIYATIIIVFAGNGSRFPQIIQWLELTRGVTDSELFFLPRPRDLSITSTENVYRHVLVITTFLTAGWLWICTRSFRQWGEEILNTYQRSHKGNAPSRDLLRTARGTAALGAFGLIFLLLFSNTNFSNAALFLTTSKWMIFRAPLLAAFIFLLTCYAVAFHQLLDHRDVR